MRLRMRRCLNPPLSDHVAGERLVTFQPILTLELLYFIGFKSLDSLYLFAYNSLLSHYNISKVLQQNSEELNVK